MLIYLPAILGVVLATLVPQAAWAEAAGGAVLYQRHCSVCHGDKGTTAIWAKSGLRPQPRDFTTAEARKELTQQRMIASVTNGRPGTAMQPHKDLLSKKQIQDYVVLYCENLAK